MSGTERLIEFNAFREAPRDIVRALRDVDPTAEMLYLGDGKWSVGRVRPTEFRRKAGKKLLLDAWERARRGELRDEEQWYRRMRWARVAMQGYAEIARYEFGGDPDWRIVRDFREAVYWDTNDRWGDEFNRRVDEHDNGKRRAAWESAMDPAKAAWVARMARFPVSIIKPEPKVSA